MIADAVKRSPDSSIYLTQQTAEEWFARRVKYQRINNRVVRTLIVQYKKCHSFCMQGPETWHASRGTEHTETV